MVQASRLCDFEQWSEADEKDAEIVLFNIFSIFSHRRRAGQVDDISSSRPWRFDTSISSAPSFLSSNRNAFINTHLLMRAAVIATNPEHVGLSTPPRQRRHECGITPDWPREGRPINQPLRNGEFLSNAKQRHECGLGESSEPPHAAQSLAGSCLGNSAANPARRRCPGSHDVTLGVSPNAATLTCFRWRARNPRVRQLRTLIASEEASQGHRHVSPSPDRAWELWPRWS